MSVAVYYGKIKVLNKTSKKEEFIPCAIKVFSRENLEDITETSKKQKEMYEREKEIGLWHKCENIVKFFGELRTKECFYLIMEYCNGGTLGAYLEYFQNQNSIPEDKIQFFVRHILKGINYLHENKIMNRDIKLDNCVLHFNDQELLYSIDPDTDERHLRYDLIDYSKCVLKLCDLGASKRIDCDIDNSLVKHTYITTPQYKAPEVETLNYDEQIDIMSLGKLVYYLIQGDVDQIGNDDLIFDKSKIYSIEIRDFLDCSLKENKEDRMNAKYLLEDSNFMTRDPSKFEYIDYNMYKNCSKIDELFVFSQNKKSNAFSGKLRNIKKEKELKK